MTALWYALVHYMGVDYGLPYGRWSWYNFHSGFGANFGEYAIVASVIALIRKMAQHHRERIAQSARQHLQLLEQQKAHHEGLKEHLAGGVSQDDFERRIKQMMRVSPQVFEDHFRRMQRREGGRPVGGDRF